MDWNRSQTIGLAKNTCTHCHGYGMRLTTRKGKEVPCNCVFREIFRICYRRFYNCLANERQISTVTFEFCSGREGRRSYGRKTEEYMADFCLIAKRILTPEEHRIFRYHFLLGADWRLCARYFKMERGNFFHLLYRIEHRLGRVFAELEPYGLYPLDEYFGGLHRRERTEATPIRPARPARTWKVPLAPAA